MDSRQRRLSRWIAGGAVFLAAATVLFETAGQSSPRPAAVRPNTYRAVQIDEPNVRTALDFAIADQKKKNRSDRAITVLRVLSAEHQASKGDNYRLCLAVNRRGRPDNARAVVHRDHKQQWSVALWAWGACGKELRSKN